MVPFRADLHMHTCHSKDSLSSVGSVLAYAVKKGLNAIAITDHDEISGAFEAKEKAETEGLKLQVIVGEEVSTDQGDLLVYFLKKRIAKGPLGAVLAEVKRQKAVCCAAHPYDFIRHGINLEKIPPALLCKIDAVEAFNARVSVQSHNPKATQFALSNGKALLAGSDAHHPSEIGAAYVEFEGVRQLDAKQLLFSKRKITGALSPKYVHAFSRYAMLRKKLGWKMEK